MHSTNEIRHTKPPVLGRFIQKVYQQEALALLFLSINQNYFSRFFHSSYSSTNVEWAHRSGKPTATCNKAAFAAASAVDSVH